MGTNDNYRTTRAATALAGVLILLSGLALVGAAVPARGDVGCAIDGNDQAVLNLDDSGDPYVLKMKNNKLLVNGVSCGSPRFLFIQDYGDITSDNVIFDLTEPFRANGQRVLISQNLRSHVMQDTITIRGAKTKDIVSVGYTSLTVKAATDYAPNDAFRFSMPFQSSGVKLIFKLRGGNDRFDMVVDGLNRTAAGPVIANGGAGKDRLNGSVGKQKLEGGKGADVLNGKQGPDKLYGNGGDDELSGGKGSDFLHGGSGEDDVAGGSGADEAKLNDGEVDTFDGGAGSKDVCNCDAVDITTGLP